jgi:8-oxo-dGTP pyrophosphatase MutT (NUDIX family)
MSQDTVRLLLLDGQKRMLLVQKTETAAWHWPGGKRKPNEKFTEALTREVFEETGLHIVKIQLIHTEHLTQETIRCYTAHCKNMQCKKPDGKEISKICWRSLARAKRLPLTETQKRLQQNIAIIARFV